MKHLTKHWHGDNNDCGHYALAMATDMPLWNVYGAVGRRGSTSEGVLLRALERLGFTSERVTDEEATAGRGFAIIQNAHKTQGHAVAWENAKTYDPDGEDAYSNFEELREFYAMHGNFEVKIYRVEPVKFREWAVGKR